MILTNLFVKAIVIAGTVSILGALVLALVLNR
jgi:hypothetical protein